MNRFAVIGSCDGALPADWRDRLVAMLGAKPRRIGPWAELALYGALRCMAAAEETRLPPDATLVLASRHGTRAATVAALGQMSEDLPMPLLFLQTQPNQVLALLGERLCWRGHGCFLAGGTLADARRMAEVQAGTGGALLGWVDDLPGETSIWLRLRRLR